ncbi:MAG: hypothetical protein KF891_23855 [Rhizobacter sp.]|nr:hypothetical protein [Rhizobacter sp.]
MSPQTPNPQTKKSPPWWRVGMVWLVLGGPAVVVVASFVTLKIALTHIDPVLQTQPAYAHPSAVTPHTPALQARNHAATPRP